MPALILSHVSKAYRHYTSKWDRLLEWVDPQERPRHQKHWILKDLSLEIGKGEVVSIMGFNGAGKSTLLKLIAGTSKPTQGSVQVFGRVAPLLELGIGFHPNFTGLQNVVMAQQILGRSDEEVKEVMPWVHDFSDIGPYFYEPLRTYSSGMQARLAFAVAVSKRPDILIVDEALAVGDASFQSKCYDLIRSYVHQGTTLLFVTHNPEPLQDLCQRAILLRDGGIFFDGEPEKACHIYHSHNGL